MGIFSKFFIFWVNEGKTNVQNEFQSSSSKNQNFTPKLKHSPFFENRPRL